ncbi:hypothetical protein NMY22_g10607 [Coprinellus aureogranulatus]|nr:hypothetical protein NMY22_g10607 [Coprinellus aureogranulatus]
MLRPGVNAPRIIRHPLSTSNAGRSQADKENSSTAASRSRSSSADAPPGDALGKRSRSDEGIEDPDSNLSWAPRKKPSRTDPLVGHGRHFGRTIHAFCRIFPLIKDGLSRQLRFQAGVLNEEELSDKEWIEHEIFQELLDLNPGLQNRILKSSGDELHYIADMLNKGSSGARADDTKSLKSTDRGFYHDATGALLCPATLDWNDPPTRTQLKTGEITVSGEVWPVFLYREHKYDPEDPWDGLLQGSLLLSAYKHVFTSPSSSIKRHALPARETLNCTVRFALSSSAVFSRNDRSTDSERFYNSIIDLLDSPSEKVEVEALMKWWNVRIFPSHHSEGNRGKVVVPTVLDAISKSRARKRQPLSPLDLQQIVRFLSSKAPTILPSTLMHGADRDDVMSANLPFGRSKFWYMTSPAPALPVSEASALKRDRMASGKPQYYEHPVIVLPAEIYEASSDDKRGKGGCDKEGSPDNSVSGYDDASDLYDHVSIVGLYMAEASRGLHQFVKNTSWGAVMDFVLTATRAVILIVAASSFLTVTANGTLGDWIVTRLHPCRVHLFRGTTRGGSLKRTICTTDDYNRLIPPLTPLPENPLIPPSAMSARARTNGALPPEGTVRGIRARLRRPRWPWPFPRVILEIRGQGRHAAVFEATAESAGGAARVARTMRDLSSDSSESEGGIHAEAHNSEDGHDEARTVDIQQADVQAIPGSLSDSDSDVSVNLNGLRDGRPRLGEEFTEEMTRRMDDFRASVEPVVEDGAPELHLVLLSPAGVGRFREIRGVGGADRSTERNIPEIGRVLLSYADTVEAREAVDAVVRVLILPQNRFLRNIVVFSLDSPAIALAVFAVAVGFSFYALVSYTPAHLILHRYIVGPVKDFAKILVYCLLYSLYLTFVKVWRVLHCIFVLVKGGLLGPMHETAVGYLKEFRELEAGAASTDAL